MKMTKKKVFVSALAICIIAILSFSTIAWFSASDEVTNKFLFTDSNSDGTPDFSIDIYETETDGDDTADQDGDGDPIYTNAGNTYEDILPGDVLDKDPTVKNTGEYSQYVRVTVTLSDATAWINLYGVDFEIESLLTGFNEEDWSSIEKTIEGETDTITYVLYYDGVLAADETVTVFEKIKIPEALTDEQVTEQELTSGFEIDILAEAVQSENTGATAEEAFALVTSTQAI